MKQIVGDRENIVESSQNSHRILELRMNVQSLRVNLNGTAHISQSLASLWRELASTVC